MKVSVGLILLAVAALAVSGVSAKGEKSNGMRLDWSNSYTKEELEAGAFLTPTKKKTSSRMINGDVIKRPTRAPYVGSLYRIRGSNWTFACTCVVVDTYIIMTAAHCTFPDESNAKLGICVSDVELDKGRCVEVARVKIPQKYLGSDFDVRNPFTHDVALLRTSKKLVQRGSKAKIIRVDLDPSRIGIRGVRGYIFGYGDKDAAATRNDGKLRIVDVEFSKFTLCSPGENDVNGKNFLCSDGNYDGSEGSSCFGDSGGPMVWSTNGTGNPDTHVLVGISSFIYTDPNIGGFSCDVQTPGGYSRIASVAQSKWLVKAMDKMNGEFTMYEG